MITVIADNNNKFDLQTFDLDTDEDIFRRIAVKLGTDAKYLYFPKGKPNIKEVKKVKVEDLLKLIKTNSEDSTDFFSFLDEEKFKDLRVKEDILYVWLAYNKPWEEAVEYSSTDYLDEV